jgi:hypothetical protein
VLLTLFPLSPCPPVPKTIPSKAISTKLSNRTRHTTRGTSTPTPPAVSDTTWNPANKSFEFVLSNGDLTATHDQGYNASSFVYGTDGLGATGDHSFTVTVTVLPAGGFAIGLSNSGFDGPFNGNTAFVNVSGDICSNSEMGATLGAVVLNDVITVRVNNNKAFFRRNAGNWNANASADPVTGVGGIDLTYLAGNHYPMVYAETYTTQVVANFDSWL